MPPRKRNRLWWVESIISPGALIILAIALASAAAIAVRPDRYFDHELEMWAFANTHVAMYRPLLADWNSHHPDLRVNLLQLSVNVEQQRMMSGFYSDTPIADVMEVERGKVGAIFSGPLDKIGLYDLTQRLEDEHIYDQINKPSFSPWTTRGHVFGLPHDIHPSMLIYRSDIVEAAGIDVSKIQTWDDYARIMRPLMNDKDAEGKPLHYLLNIWTTSPDQLEILILQNDGDYFDANGTPTLNSEPIAHVISQVVAWCYGPNRIAADAPEFDQGANTLRIQGYIIGSLAPDWLTGVWQHDMPQLKGKVKLMPLPAWKPGGRRTGIWGGTMLGISKRTRDFDKAWTFAKNLYLNPDVAHKLYKEAGIVSPVKKMWPDPIYDEPSEYFSGQPAGRLYLNLASEVPLRTTSPFYVTARERLQRVLQDLKDYAVSQKVYDVENLEPKAHELLQVAQKDLENEIQHNLFELPQSPAGGPEVSK